MDAVLCKCKECEIRPLPGDADFVFCLTNCVTIILRGPRALLSIVSVLLLHHPGITLSSLPTPVFLHWRHCCLCAFIFCHSHPASKYIKSQWWLSLTSFIWPTYDCEMAVMNSSKLGCQNSPKLNLDETSVGKNVYTSLLKWQFLWCKARNQD